MVEDQWIYTYTRRVYSTPWKCYNHNNELGMKNWVTEWRSTGSLKASYDRDLIHRKESLVWIQWHFWVSTCLLDKREDIISQGGGHFDLTPKWVRWLSFLFLLTRQNPQQKKSYIYLTHTITNITISNTIVSSHKIILLILRSTKTFTIFSTLEDTLFFPEKCL